jgi:hypothetical protein
VADTPETQPIVRCVSCGFLAKHRERWHEAPPEERASGYLSGAAGTGYDRETNPRIACFRNEFPLAQEYEAMLAAIGVWDEILPRARALESVHERWEGGVVQMMK